MEALIPPTIFTILYFILGQINIQTCNSPPHLDDKHRLKYLSHRISIVHSVVAFTLASYLFVCDGGINYESNPDPYHSWLLAHSLGYFTYDIIYSEIYRLHALDIRLHHMCIFLGGYVLYLADKGGSIGICKYYSDCMIVGEISNPFQQLRNIMIDEKRENEVLFQVNEAVFISLFVINRGFFGTLINYNSCFYDISLPLMLVISLMYAGSMNWILMMFSLLARKLGKNKEKLSVLARIYMAIMNTVKGHKQLATIVVFSYALLLPSVLKYLGFRAFHIVIDNFNLA